MTLEQQINRICLIYGRRNDWAMPKIELRLVFLNTAIKFLCDAYDERDELQYGKRLASVFARWAAAVEFMSSLKVSKEMASKYGAGCAYCKHSPCECPKRNRLPAQHVIPTSAQMDWSIKQWQDHLCQLYGKKNEENGLDHALRRLLSEAAEALGNWFIISTEPPQAIIDMERLNQELMFELCDVFARLLAVSSLLGIGLENAVDVQYRNGCSNCHRFPCACGVVESGYSKGTGTRTV